MGVKTERTTGNLVQSGRAIKDQGKRNESER